MSVIMGGIRVNLKTGEITYLKERVYKTQKIAIPKPKKPVKVLPIVVPYARIANRTKMPHFVKDPYQWANATFGKYKAIDCVPKKNTEEWGLYKYGEWLFNNVTYSQKYEEETEHNNT